MTRNRLWVTCFLAFLFTCSMAHGEEIKLKVVGWNVESGDASQNHIAQRIKDQSSVDLWGLSEVENDSDAKAFEAAAEDGENADFKRIVGTTGGSDRLVILYNSNRLDLVQVEELHDMNIGGHVRAPLVATFKGKTTGKQVIFVVNHLYRGSASGRHTQSKKLNAWAKTKTLPIIAVGDYNYDFHYQTGDVDHDQGLDLLTAEGVFSWVRPTTLVPTNASGHESVLDFVFVSGDAAGWQFESKIIVAPGDFPDNAQRSDHRMVDAVFTLNTDNPQPISPLAPGGAAPAGATLSRAEILQRIERIEAELQVLRQALEQDDNN